MAQVQTSTNLDRLVKAGVVPQTKAENLQRRGGVKLDQIDRLKKTEIDAIIRIHKKVGVVMGCNFI